MRRTVSNAIAPLRPFHSLLLLVLLAVGGCRSMPLERDGFAEPAPARSRAPGAPRRSPPRANAVPPIAQPTAAETRNTALSAAAKDAAPQPAGRPRLENAPGGGDAEVQKEQKADADKEGGSEPATLEVRRSAPTVVGAQLQLAPGETATQRALQLKDKLAEAEAAGAALKRRVEELEGELKKKDEALARAAGEMQTARQELVHAREELKRWKQQLWVLRDKLQKADQEKLATLQSTAALLRQLLGPDADEAGAASEMKSQGSKPAAGHPGAAPRGTSGTRPAASGARGAVTPGKPAAGASNTQSWKQSDAKALYEPRDNADARAPHQGSGGGG